MLAKSERNIEFLLNKYKTKQPGEILISENLKKDLNNNEWRKRQKLRMADNIMDRLNLKGTQRQRVKYLISNLDFNEVCRNCSNETIITAISFYIKKDSQTSAKLRDYKICEEYNLTETNFATIMVRLCSQIQKNNISIINISPPQ